MHTSSSTTTILRQPTLSSTANPAIIAGHKIFFSTPVSPSGMTGTAAINLNRNGESTPEHAHSHFPVSGGAGNGNIFHASPTLTSSISELSTPKKKMLDSVTLQTIREKLKTPGGACELHSLRLECGTEPVDVIKDRYLISSQPSLVAAVAAARTPTSYSHLVDMSSWYLKCTDVFTEEQFLCKIIKEPLHKVQRAYFQLKQEDEHCRSYIYGHSLIRGVHDIVSKSSTCTYLIIAPPTKEDGADSACIYEDLHTYIRNKRRIGEDEARALFHQICQTVQVCHRNGIILRDLKLKRFHFIDKERTKLQYESLEGSMILDNPANDTLIDKIGCPLYTAPELLCPNPTYRGKPADMWSLGVILYTMLVGQYPFYEKGNCNLITIIRHSQAQIPATLSRSVRSLLLCLLRKKQEERLQAHEIFYAPWLKEQRPYYTGVPVDVHIPDDESKNDEDGAAGISAMPFFDDDDDSIEPLDYIRSALEKQMEVEDADGHHDGDVEMG